MYVLNVHRKAVQRKGILSNFRALASFAKTKTKGIFVKTRICQDIVISTCLKSVSFVI
jgi:hypothetical protein